MVAVASALSLYGHPSFGETSDKEKEREILSGQFTQDSQDHAIALGRTTAHITQAFVEELERLEKRAASAGHYELALRWQNERQQLLENAAQLDPRHQLQDREAGVSLLPRDAALSGATSVSDQRLERWRTKGSATWNLRGFHPGRYRVWARYACDPETKELTDDDGKKVTQRSGGKISFSEQSNLIGAGGQTLTHRVLPTPDSQTPRDMLLGEIDLKQTAPTLRLEAVEVESLGLFTLFGLRLQPHFAGPEPKSNATSMTEIRRAFQSALLKRLRPLREHHLARLEQLKLRAESEDKAAFAKALEAKMKQLRSSSTDRP